MKNISYISRWALTIAFFVSMSIQSSEKEDIKTKQSQLQQLKKDIERYEEKIKESEKKEHATLELLDIYDRQAVLLKKLIRQFHDEETSLKKEIDGTRSSVRELTSQIQFLKRQYAQYITTAYKYGRTYDLELLLSSRSFNQMFIRSEYLKRFSEQRRKDVEKIDYRRDDLESYGRILEEQLIRQRKLITEKSKEEKKLEQQRKKRKALLTEIKRDKKNYRQELNRKLESVKELEQMITKLIEKEKSKKKSASEISKKGKISSKTGELASGSFEARRGSIRWPVDQGKLVSRFGNHRHPTLNTVTQNPGIDISVPLGTQVVNVAEGEVSAIWWLPSFGNLIILNHNSGFRTVYAHLAEISVSEGEQLPEGGLIGKSGESLSGPMLHFEIWKDREKQNPEQWLRPRGVTSR